MNELKDRISPKFFTPDAEAASPVEVSAEAEIAPLTTHEERKLTECEQVLSIGLATFFEVGAALLTIRDAQLYRGGYRNFETYCNERWGIGRTHAWRLIGAATRLKLLPPGEGTPRPTNEYQMRPFLRLEPEAFPRVWEQALARAQNGRVTSNLVQRIIAEVRPARLGCAKPPKPRKPINPWQRPSAGQLLVLLEEARRRIQKAETEQALAALDRIELLVFGPSLSLSRSRDSSAS
jgi:hypothetical protein